MELRDSEWAEDRDLVGYEVEGEDGSLGKVDQATADTDGAWLVVDTGFWIFGKKRVIPAGTVVGMDHDGRRIIVNVSKDQVKEAPDYAETPGTSRRGGSTPSTTRDARATRTARTFPTGPGRAARAQAATWARDEPGCAA